MKVLNQMPCIAIHVLWRICLPTLLRDIPQYSPPVNYVYHKMSLNENESYLVLVAKQILVVTINNVYW